MTSGPITRHASAWAIGLMQIRIGACAANIANISPVLTSAHSIGAMASTKFNGSADFFKQMSGFPEREDGSIPLREAAAIEAAFKEITPYNMAIARGLDPTASLVASSVKDIHRVSAAGTTASAMQIEVSGSGAWGVIDEEWIVLFTSATGGVIIGKTVGMVHSFIAINSAIEPVHDSTLKYFSIPANFFTGTWAENDMYIFRTYAGGASAYSDPHVGSIGLGGLVAPVDIRVEAVFTFPNGINTLTFVFPRAQAVASMELDYNAEDAASSPITLESKNASSDNALGNVVWDSMPLGRILWA